MKKSRTTGLTLEGYHVTAKEWSIMLKALEAMIKTDGKKKSSPYKDKALSEIPKDMKKLKKVIGVTVWY